MWDDESDKVFKYSKKNADRSNFQQQFEYCSNDPSQAQADEFFNTVYTILFEQASDCGILKLKNASKYNPNKLKSC